MRALSPFSKAIAGAVGGALTSGLAALTAALADDHVSALEWTLVASATLMGSGLTAAGVFFAPANKGKHSAPDPE